MAGRAYTNMWISWREHIRNFCTRTKKDPTIEELRKHVDLWEFVVLDARPLVIVDKQAACLHRYDDLAKEAIIFRNRAFEKLAASLDLDVFMVKLLNSPPGAPLYMAGKLWGNYLVEEGDYTVITGDAAEYPDAVLWTPAEGWQPSSAPRTSMEHPYQNARRETSKSAIITKDRMPPSHTLLDWTRFSASSWLPQHYRTFVSVRWQDTSLGKMTDWSSSLRTVINSIMQHPYQTVLYWGTKYVVVYNEAYVDVIKNRHPGLMGKKLAKAWPECYNKIHHHLDECMLGRNRIRTGDQIPVDRTDRDEECYFDWTLTPILEKAGNVGGVLWQQYEGTARVLQNRRQQMLKALRSCTATARSSIDFWPSILEAFDSNTFDTPFVILYEIRERNQNEGVLLGTRGISSGHIIAPRVRVLAEDEHVFAKEIREARKTGKAVVVDGLLKYAFLRDICKRGFQEPCASAVVIPIRGMDQTGRTEAIIILGINPRRPFDADYQIWVDQMGDSITMYLAEVRNLEKKVEEEMLEKLHDVDKRRASELSHKLKELEGELRQTEMKFSKMASVIPVGLLELDAGGTARYTNDAWHEIMMLPRNRDQRTWVDVIHPDDKGWWMSRLEQSVGIRDHVPIEYRIVGTKGDHNEGRVKGVVSEVVPIFDEIGALLGFYSTVVDITPLKDAEKIQKDRADDAIQEKRFIDMTCHELRNPLSAILQSSELVLDLLEAHEQSGNKTQIDLAAITESCNTIILCTLHQRRIVDDILVTSKMDSNLLPVNPVSIRPASFLENSLKMFEPETDSHGIKLSTVIDESYHAAEVEWAMLDPARILQVLVNLLSNAIKFTMSCTTKEITVSLGATKEEPKSFGSVEYSLKEPNKKEAEDELYGTGELLYLMFTVTDTGIGVAADDQKKLFQRFQQAPKTASKYGGSGLGLYICKNLSRLMGGSIGIASEEGKGSSFSFYVKTRRISQPEKEAVLSQFLTPASGGRSRAYLSGTRTSSKDESNNPEPVETQLARTPIKASTLVARRGRGPADVSVVSGYKILIVEDNLINQTVLKRQLDANKCVTYTASNGQEAVDFIRRSALNVAAGEDAVDIEVCLMDCEMPIMNGIAASKKIREMEASGILSRHLPILGVSANVRAEKVKAMKDAGMDDTISKPFRLKDLIQKAAALVKLQSIDEWTGESVSSTGVPPGDESIEGLAGLLESIGRKSSD